MYCVYSDSLYVPIFILSLLFVKCKICENVFFCRGTVHNNLSFIWATEEEKKNITKYNFHKQTLRTTLIPA